MSSLLNIRNYYAQQLASQFDTSLMMNLEESIRAIANRSLQFLEDNIYNPDINSIAKPQYMYVAVMQGTDDALRASDDIYRLKHTSPKGGIYPFIDLPSFTIITRSSNTLRAYRNADYLKLNALSNAKFRAEELDLFDVAKNPILSEPDRVFMILDVYIESQDNAYFNFLLPHSNLRDVHFNIPYDEIIQLKSQPIIDDSINIKPATPKLKKMLQDLDKKSQ